MFESLTEAASCDTTSWPDAITLSVMALAGAAVLIFLFRSL